MGEELLAGSVFVQQDIPFTIETSYTWAGDGINAHQEPDHDFWQIGERETQYGSTNDGLGRFELHVLEIVNTNTSGPVAIYERRWFDPEGALLSKPRKKYSKVANLKGFIRRRKMTLSAAASNPLGAAPSAAGSASTAQHPEHMLAPKEER